MEKLFIARSGYLVLALEALLLALAVFSFVAHMVLVGVVLLALFILTAPGFVTVDPNRSCVLVLFGEYKGTIKANGFFG